MISAGNDIIDLKKIDAERTKQPRFFSKILVDSEMELYNDCKILPFENFVWLLWSVKESVYKYRKRNKPSLLFSPKKIIARRLTCPPGYTAETFGKSVLESTLADDANSFRCTVEFDGDYFYTVSHIYNDLIFTFIQNGETAGNTWWGIKYIDDERSENQSAQVRQFLLNRISPLFKDDILCFKKATPGYPVLATTQKEMSSPISFAHHGNFIGYFFYSGAHTQ